MKNPANSRSTADRRAAALRGRARKDAARLAADEAVASSLNDMLVAMQIGDPKGWHLPNRCAADWPQVQALLRVIAHYKLKAKSLPARPLSQCPCGEEL